MKTMVLVPEAHVEELKRLRLYQSSKLPPKPEIIQTVDIQKRIDELMTDPNISATDKMQRYGEYMLQYNSFKDQAMATEEVSKAPTYIPTTINMSTDKTLLSDENVIATIPESMKSPVRRLISKLKLNSNVSWDSKGVVSINGKEIPGSNIVDILNDAARERKNTPPAKGWMNVAEALHDNNQTFYVRNKRWRDYVKKTLKNKDSLDTSLDTSTLTDKGDDYDDISTPLETYTSSKSSLDKTLEKRKQQLLANKSLWENWKP